MQKHTLGLRQQNMRSARACTESTRFQRARSDLRTRSREEISGHFAQDLRRASSSQRSIESLLALSIEPDYFLKALEEQDRFDD